MRKSVDTKPPNTATARQLIADGARLFESVGLAFAHGTDNALDEAATLVLHALCLDFGIPDAVLDEELDAEQVYRARELLQERVSTRKPAAYLIRESWFAGMPFYVDERVLVPRSPLAELVENRFEPWIEPGRVGRILDLCTGSGCIGIACAYYFQDAQVTITDLSADALQVAAINIERHQLAARVMATQSDVYSALQGQRFDIVVSNPPYVPVDEMEELADEFRFEPAMGLVAGRDGLDVVVRILRDAAQHLEERGILVVEVGYTQDLLIEQFPEVPFLWLDFEFGGEGVFVLDREQLLASQWLFDEAVTRRATGDMVNDVE
jgi:ribosomal protein L3 glutamine methyltransferase